MNDRPALQATPTAALRAVVLGASNLTIHLPAVLAHLCRGTGGPVEVLAACGHGRSYGDWSRLLWMRGLPGIRGCGLWAGLARRPSMPTLALVTDVGNDLGYGASAATIAGWVADCVERLSSERAKIVLTLPPLETFQRLPAWQFHAARTLLFPGRRIVRRALLAEAEELCRRLRRLAEESGAVLVEPELAWYGIDPIHLRRSAAPRAWETILGGWDLPPRPGRGRPFRLPRLLLAEELRLFGRPVSRPQPCWTSPDGTALSLY